VIVDRKRVIAFIDGLNLYHATSRLDRPELLWIDLWALSKKFLKAFSEELCKVYYFSAYADHVGVVKKDNQKAHMLALTLRGVVPVLGQFKNKDRKCPTCDYKWIGHEEKETDVNIAVYLLDLAYQNTFDRALVISNDSDLSPAIRMVRLRFPDKRITTVAPPNAFHSNALIQASSDKSKIRIEHLERCQLPPVVYDASRLISASRPHEYMPLGKSHEILT
jgi:uncharacterized LabA/DUF88 family protein